MVFTSFNFLLFFPIVCIVYFLTPGKYRWLTLLISSYFFYINVKPVYALLTVFITVSTYLFTRLIDETTVESRKKYFLVVNIVLILLPLCFYKYFSVFNNWVFAVLETHNLRWLFPEIKLILPIGISFYTFMALGYTIDVYNEKVESEKHIGILALFISFFPLILSGPIERAKNMLPQLRFSKGVEYSDLLAGLKLMLWGYFMKLVVADRVSIYVDAVYNNISQHNGTTLLFASFLYPFQVYADLGGYSLIAIGTSRVLGIDIMQNFNRPFFASSMAEFWRRWHISLITWLTDYIYTPLSFSFRKRGVWGIVLALIITFIISGIWHGAALTFIIWGLMQGLFLSVEALINNRRSGFEKKFSLNTKIWYMILSISLTFVLFTASLVFARAPNVNDALTIYRNIFSDSGPLFIADWAQLIYAVSGITFLMIIEFYQEYKAINQVPFTSKFWIVDQLAYVFLLILILLTGVFDGGQFIYFKF